MCAAYNLTAACFRRDRHLKFNAVLYTLVTAWELKQTLHHLNQAVACDSETEIQPAA
jgi:hypothetical protein